jgi:hypothetical protein
MKLETQLFEECKNRAMNCSITYQYINGYSIEIYKGYETSYQKIFYTDGHTDPRIAIRKGLKFLCALKA